jgi:molybdopterin-guanine dinucleotide biosynthesis protein A
MPTSVIILAGGQSRRMGRSKAWLEFGGRPLLAQLVERLAGAFPEVVVVGAPGQELPATPARLITDERPGEGPLAGLEAGLAAIGEPRALVCCCDAPFVNPAVALRLSELCEGFDAAVPRWGGRLQPLHAVYSRSARTAVARRLAGEHRRVMDLLEQLRVRVVDEAELRPLDPLGLTFFNVNCPEDYLEAVRLWQSVFAGSLQSP